MQNALLSLLLGGLVRDALKVAGGVAVAIVVALAFAVASVMTLFYGVVPAQLATARPAAHGPLPTAAAPDGSVLGVARAFVGTPYVWGGASPSTGFDCSGLVQWSYGRVGVALPRTAQQQFDATVRVRRDELQPGDLVFFAHTYPSHEPITHVGIYAGNGRMLNAPVEGDVIREMDVFTGFWGSHFAGAGRPSR
jgi:cell wall-associated NlpC family hydrolase